METENDLRAAHRQLWDYLRLPFHSKSDFFASHEFILKGKYAPFQKLLNNNKCFACVEAAYRAELLDEPLICAKCPCVWGNAKNICYLSIDSLYLKYCQVLTDIGNMEFFLPEKRDTLEELYNQCSICAGAIREAWPEVTHKPFEWEAEF